MANRINVTAASRRTSAREKDEIFDSFLENKVSPFLKELKQLSKGNMRRTTKSRGSNHIHSDRQLAQLCDDIVREGEAVLSGISDRKRKKSLKANFRKLLKPWMKGNPFLLRSLAKPRGYPGDYMMMEMGYESKVVGGPGLSGQFDKYLFKRYYSVMCRKNKVRDYLRTFLMNRESGDEIVKILTLGGGPSREWFELATEVRRPALSKKVLLEYIDYDSEAIAFSKKRLTNNYLIKSVRFIRESLLTFCRSSSWIKKERAFDLIYAIGIADYFPDSVLCEIIVRALTLLKDNGTLVLAHKDEEMFTFSILDWFCDWTFFRRTQADFSKVLDSAVRETGRQFSYTIEHDETGEFMFFIVKSL